MMVSHMLTRCVDQLHRVLILNLVLQDKGSSRYSVIASHVLASSVTQTRAHL
jgi:hypothetical protein